MSLNLRNALSNAFVGGGGGGATLAANTFTGAQAISANGAASTPPLSLTGTIFTGGTATTTKPQLLIEPSGTTSTGWSTGGTGLGVNLPAFAAFTNSASLASTTMLADWQEAGVRQLAVTQSTFGGISNAPTLLGGGGNFPVCLSLVGGNGLAYFRRIDDGWLMGMGSGFMAVPSGARIGFSDQATGSNVPTSTGSVDAFFARSAAASIQMGSNHATTATNQTFKAHDVTTGAGADLFLQGGEGSANDGYVKIGTAKGGLAFFGAAGSPLISGSTNTNISSGGAGSALLDDTQSDGGLGGGAYTFGGLVAVLKSYGIIG